VILAFALLAQSLLMLGVYAYDVWQGTRFGGDFIVFHQAASKLAHGLSAQLYDPSSLQEVLSAKAQGEFFVTPFVYPPMMALVVWPLGYFSYSVAVAIWSLLPAALFFWLLVRVLIYSEKEADKLYPLAAAFTLPFITCNILSGQTGTLLAVLFLAGLHGLQKNRWWAGIPLGAMIIKPQLGLLLPFMFIASRRWRDMLVASVTVLLFALAATAVLGIGIWSEYFSILHLFTQFAQERFASFAAMVLGPYMSLHSAGLASDNAACVQAIISLFVIAVVMHVFRYAPSGSPCLRFGILATGALIATPHAMAYDTPLMAIAVCTLLLMAWRKGWSNGYELAAFACMLIAPYAQPSVMQWGIPVAWLATLVFFVILVRRYRIEFQPVT
jgi:alpha-1,2-mannosyltransferase